MTDGADAVTELADALRAAGVALGTGQVVTCARAMARVEPADLADRYWAGRITLVTDPRDLATYDRVFADVTGAVAGQEPTHDATRVVASGTDAASDRSGGRERAGAEAPAGAVVSARERLRHRRFDRATDDELREIGELLRRLEVAVPHRVTRRSRPGPRGELDLPRTLERALATDGEWIDRAWQHRRTRPRRLVLLLDVSGSMAGHARGLLRFAVAARRTAVADASRRVEVFAFGTRLTRLTDALAVRDPDVAIAAAAAAVVDWDGGTRIGDNLERLTRVWGRRGLLRGAVVVVCSDGLERGDPERLAAAVARLRRQVHRLVWVNPLAGDPRYQPAQRGIRAALPYVDVFLPGHDLASLEQLSRTLAALRGRAGSGP